MTKEGEWEGVGLFLREAEELQPPAVTREGSSGPAAAQAPWTIAAGNHVSLLLVSLSFC